MTCNLSPGSEATSPQWDETCTLPPLLSPKHIPTSPSGRSRRDGRLARPSTALHLWMSWHSLLKTERSCQETSARPPTCRGISISLKYHASLSLHASCPHLCKPQCAGARPSLAKRLNFEQSVRCSGKKYLSDCRKVSLFIYISDSLSCTYSPCMFWYSHPACPATMFQSVYFSSSSPPSCSSQSCVCLPTSSPLRPHFCWALCLATHRD